MAKIDKRSKKRQNRKVEKIETKCRKLPGDAKIDKNGDGVGGNGENGQTPTK